MFPNLPVIKLPDRPDIKNQYYSSETMEIKAFLFDLDGVLVDTAKYHYLAWRKLASQLGFEFSEEQNERLKGVSRMASLGILLEVGGIHVSEEEKIRMAEMKNNWYVQLISSMTPDEILPGVSDFLNLTKKMGIKTAICSASKNTPLILDRTGLGKWFDSVVDGNRATLAKPNPQVFNMAADDFGLKPAQCLVFEDAEAGIEAAINAGMKSIGIGNSEILGKADLVFPDLRNTTPEMILKALTQNIKNYESIS